MTNAPKVADELPQIVVGLPGPWKDLPAAMKALVQEGRGRYVGGPLSDMEPGSSGAGLLDRQTNWACLCDLQPRNKALAVGFAKLGFGRVSPRDAQKVSDEHRGILILTAQGGSVETAGYLFDAITTVVRAGGLGVIIESSGIAHTARDWLKLAGADDTAGSLYWAFVATIGPKGPQKRIYYTCGMHNLGLRDAITDLFENAQEAAYVMHTFLGYVYQSGAAVADGDMIGGEDGPHFRVRMEPCRTYDPPDLFHNPYGMWRIVAAEGD